MDALALVLISGTCLLIAYFTYGRWLSARVFQLDPNVDTPATTENDGRDFVPTPKSIIFGHHFTSIAGTGPIVGPAIAVMWGWLPAILWVVIGAIFIGAVHDLGAIVVSLRKKGRSIGDIAGDLLGPRARLIFLCILIVGLWIVLAVFGLVIAAVLRQYPAAVFPVLVQIPLAIFIGAFVHRRGKSIVIPSILALALMYASVLWGDVGLLGQFNAALAAQPIFLWVCFLLAYAYVASVLPVWVLLQPRDYINALQLLTALALITLGLLAAATFGGAGGTALRAVSEEASATGQSPVPPGQLELVAPMIDWQPVGAPPMLPVLFITIACGACSGFHCLVGSGTTSKQISKETHAKAVGYGAMLTEGFLATLVIAACAAGIGMGVVHTQGTYGAVSWWHENPPEYNGRFTSDTLPIRSVQDAQPRAHTLWTGSIWRASPGDAPPVNTEIVEFRALLLPEGARVPSFGCGKPGSSFGSSGVIPEPNVEGAAEPYGLVIQVEPPASEHNLDGHALLELSSSRSPISLVASDERIEVFWPDSEEDVHPITFETEGGRAILIPPHHSQVELLPDLTLPESANPSLLLTGRLAFNKQYESWSAAGSLGAKVGAFVEGAANFVASLGIARDIAIALMAVMVASFAATTMDTACRLQRYVIQELSSTFLPRVRRYSCVSCGYDLSGHFEGGTALRAVSEGATGQSPVPPGSITCPECGREHPADEVYHHDRDASWKRARFFNPFKWLATVHGATLFAVVTAALLAAIPPAGQPWTIANAGRGALILWPLFGATNQLLAGFAFVVIVAWLIATHRPKWFAIPPAVIMLIVPAAAMTWQAFVGNDDNPSWLSSGNWLLLSIGVVTLALEAWLVIETVLRIVARKSVFLNE